MHQVRTSGKRKVRAMLRARLEPARIGPRGAALSPRHQNLTKAPAGASRGHNLEAADN
jgi:hypothetical protein